MILPAQLAVVIGEPYHYLAEGLGPRADHLLAFHFGRLLWYCFDARALPTEKLVAKLPELSVACGTVCA